METIKSYTNATSSLLLTHPEWGGGIHGGRLSGRMHYELRSLIDASRNKQDFLRRMSRFSRRWVTADIHALPIEMRKAIEKFRNLEEY